MDKLTCVLLLISGIFAIIAIGGWIVYFWNIYQIRRLDRIIEQLTQKESKNAKI